MAGIEGPTRTGVYWPSTNPTTYVTKTRGGGEGKCRIHCSTSLTVFEAIQ